MPAGHDVVFAFVVFRFCFRDFAAILSFHRNGAPQNITVAKPGFHIDRIGG